MRVKKSVAAVWWFQFNTTWNSIGRMINGMPPLFDNNGYAWFQPQFTDPRNQK